MAPASFFYGLLAVAPLDQAGHGRRRLVSITRRQGPFGRKDLDFLERTLGDCRPADGRWDPGRPRLRKDGIGMAERNRVLPDGSIVAVPARGAWMGNRGCLHEGHQIVRPWRLRAWLTCRLSFHDRQVEQWAPRRYTPLFFLDEAVAFAAGHRPCGECRHHDYLAYRDTAGAASAGELDARLDAERRAGPARVPWRDLPDGAFALTADGPALVLGDRLVRWDDEAYAYGTAAPRPRSGRVDVLTPPTTLDVLRNGVPVQVDDAARRRAREAPDARSRGSTCPSRNSG